jgi:phosphoglycolate phosphatase
VKYRLAIFDFDGTLADSFPWFIGAVNHAADRYRFRRIEDHELDTLRGYDTRKLIRHLRMPRWKMPLVTRHMRGRMAHDIEQIELFPGVDGMLERLADQGVAIAIVTSNSVGNVRRVLGPRNAGLVQYYGCGASILGKRPKLRNVLRSSGIPPSAAISIGDEIRDMQAAHAEGIAFGAVSWGFAHPESLRAHGPEEVFGSVEEIAEKLARAA